MKTALIFLIIGIGEGMILCDWLRVRQTLTTSKKKR